MAHRETESETRARSVTAGPDPRSFVTRSRRAYEVRRKVFFCLWVLLPVLPLIAPHFTVQTSHAAAKETQSPSSTHSVKSGAGAGKGAPDGAELPRTVRRADPALFISVEHVRAKLEQGQAVTLVDVRRAEEFGKLRIPGSINMPLFALKTKSFLKAEPVVLVGEGYRVCELEQECRTLRASGFTRALVLRGGLASWVEKGGPVAGDVFAREQVFRVSPAGLFAARKCSSWLGVDVSRSVTPDGSRFIPGTVSVPYRGKGEEFLREFRRAMGTQKAEQPVTVLVFSETGEGYDAVERALKDGKIGGVSYLEGGLKAYRTYLQEQKLIEKSRERSTVAQKCPTCP